jgi:hypothetical protein
VRVSVSEAALVDGLAEALRRCEFVVARTGRHELDARLAAAPPGWPEIQGAGELELDLYLRVWEARHPGVRAVRAKRA